MNHNDAHERLSLYYDDELPALERDQVKAHVDGCPACQTELKEWKQTAALVFPARHLNTDAFVTRVMANLPARSGSAAVWWKSWWRVPVFAAAALAVLIISTPTVDRLGVADSSATEGREPLEWLFGQDRDATEDVLGLLWGGV
jgi:anti-sigma factor RsiW